MKFGKTLQLEASMKWNTKWNDYYVEYKVLKKFIKENETQNTLHNEEFINTFVKLWKTELKKVDAFTKRTGSILLEKYSVDERDHEKMMQCATQVQRLAKFSEINFMALEKILKKARKKKGDGLILDALIINRLEPSKQSQSDLIEKIQKTLEDSFKTPLTITYEKDIPIEYIAEEVPTVNKINLASLPPGKITRLKLAMHDDEFSEPINVPVIICKGRFDGPVLGITSALHGNELNGIPLIFRLLRQLDEEQMIGTLVAIPVLNPPGFRRRQREFHDGQDLNRLFPGKPKGNCGQSFAHAIMTKIVPLFDYHIDLHTASFGRVNSLYVRADMNSPLSYTMAIMQQAQIIVHNTAPDGSLRSAVMDQGVPSITVEIGNPLQFHDKFISTTLTGVENIMIWLGMISDPEDNHHSEESRTKEANSDDTTKDANVDDKAKPHSLNSQHTRLLEFSKSTVICARSKWLFSEYGGILRVLPKVNTWVQQDEAIAFVQNIFGDIIHTYYAPVDAIVVGKSTNPICSTGDRIVHLGFVEETFPKKS